MNQFDNLSGVPNQGCDLAGMGFLKKIKKQVKRSVKQVKAEVKRSPVAKAALVIGAGVLLAPAAGAVIGKLGAGAAKVVGAGAKTVASNAAKKGINSRAGSALKKGAKTTIKHAPAAASVVGTGLAVSSAVGQAKAAKAARRMAAQTGDPEAQAALNNRNTAKLARNIRARIGKKTPEFERLVATRKAESKSDEEIAREWAASKSFVDTTQSAVASQIEGDIVSQLISRGMPQQQAQSYAPQIAQEIGRETGEQLQNDFGGINIKHVGIGAAILAGVYLINRKPDRKGN